MDSNKPFTVCQGYFDQQANDINPPLLNDTLPSCSPPALDGLDRKVWFDQQLNTPYEMQGKIIEMMRSELPEIHDDTTLRRVIGSPTFMFVIISQALLSSIPSEEHSDQIFGLTHFGLNVIFLHIGSFYNYHHTFREGILRNEMFSLGLIINNCMTFPLRSLEKAEVKRLVGNGMDWGDVLHSPKIQKRFTLDEDVMQQFTRAVRVGSNRFFTMYNEYMKNDTIHPSMIEYSGTMIFTDFVSANDSIANFNYNLHIVDPEKNIYLRLKRFPHELRKIQYDNTSGTVCYESRFFYGDAPSEKTRAIGLIHYLGSTFQRHVSGSGSIYDSKNKHQQWVELGSTIREIPPPIQNKFFPEFCGLMSTIITNREDYCPEDQSAPTCVSH